MPYNISWWSEGEVLYLKLYGHLTLDDLEQVTQKSLEYLEASSTIIHAITDATDVESTPSNIPTLLRKMNAGQHRNSGYTIIITSNKLITFIANTLLQVLKMQVRIVQTKEEAQKILDRVTPS